MLEVTRSTKQQSFAKRAKKILEFAQTAEFVQACKDYTNGLINQGVDLDKMSNDTFTANWIGKWIIHFSNKGIGQLSRAFSDLEGVEP